MPKKLTMEEIKSKLKIINSNIEIMDTKYINSKQPMNCHCFICDTIWKMNWNNLSNNHGCPTCYQQSKFKTDEEIINFVESQGYKFIGFLKRGTIVETRINIECPEGHIYEVSFKSFQDGRRCRKCTNKRNGISKRNNIKDVVNLIHNYGYTIIGTLNYKDNKSKFKIKCENGHIRETSYNGFSKSPECPKCTGNIGKYSIDDVRKILESFGMELLDDAYINSHTPIKHRCVCGNIAYTTLNCIMRGHKCSECCGYNKRYSLEELQLIFSENGCELLEKEITNVSNNKLKFRCKCGNTYSKTLFDFLKSPQCAECGFKSRSGENHPNWNPNLTDEERLKNRKFKEYEAWRISVYERDNYTCQCCSDNKGHNLNAHHLDSYDWAKNERLNVDNGITLCEDCHIEFHHLYGYGNNTKEQYAEYMNIKSLSNAI